jgi:glycosyltransferase involved in cell wall biosynthesis
MNDFVFTRKAPDGTRLFFPSSASSGSVDLSIVIPAMNERVTIGEFVDWCKAGLAKAGVRGQILIVDSSSDETPQIALQHGAEVLRTPKRGLGRAYIDAIPHIRGKWIIMGDADLTYDFREIHEFVEEFKKGTEFVMGSRFRGSIEAGSMPKLHRYFGTPLTTWILNFFYQSNYSDIHCGMRGLTREALTQIDLHSQSWEYASEMVLKAARLKLKTAEVPVSFYRDREGRVSHHRRMGWLSPWIAGWINLKVMLVYTPDSFLLKPGIALMAFGLILSTLISFGPFTLGPITFDLYWMLLATTCATLGYSFVQIGVLACLLHRLRPSINQSVKRFFSYNTGMVMSTCVTLLGLALVGNLAWQYIEHGLRLAALSRSAIMGLLLIIIGFQTFGFTLLLEMLNRVAKPSSP